MMRQQVVGPGDGVTNGSQERVNAKILLLDITRARFFLEQGRHSPNAELRKTDHRNAAGKTREDGPSSD